MKTLSLLLAGLSGLAYADALAPQTILPSTGRVAISGDTAIVGTSIFVRSGTGWIKQAQLTGSNTEAADAFGYAAAISGDTVVVGAYSEDSAATGVNGDQSDNSARDSGAAYVFVRNGSTWTQQAYLKASNTGGDPDSPNTGETGDGFGISVAISGDTVVIGAFGEDSAATGVNGDQSSNAAKGAGAAYIFTRSGTTWTQQAYLKPSNTDPSEAFGSVAISGDTVVVGATGEDSFATGVNGDQANNSGTEAGAAYVFVRNGTTWTQEAYLKASNPDLYDHFGGDVDVSGDTIVVGANQESSISTGVNGNPFDNSASKAGAAYVFTRNGTTWSQQAYLKASNTAKNDYYWGSLDYFAGSVAISGDKIIVGAESEDSDATGVNGIQNNNNAADSGAAYLFSRSGTIWTQQAYIKASSRIYAFGASVAVSGETVLVTNMGQAYVTDFFSGPKISVTGGTTRAFGPGIVGEPTELVFDLFNLGPAPLLLTGDPKVTLSGSSEFSVTEQPAGSIASAGGSGTFKVRYARSSEGPKSATLSILNNDADSTPYLIELDGRGLSFTTDSDGDGMNDGQEFNMAALNFNWDLNQSALVTTYLGSLNGGGLYTPAQLQALYPGAALIPRSQTSGRFKVSRRWEKATNLASFSDFPAPAGSAVSISPSGGIEFEFASPERAAFYRMNDE